METRPHLLVVDDHDAFLRLTALRLRALGCTCVAVSSVAAAIDALARERFDTVLSDHSLPGPNGLDLLAYMRHRHPEIPFLLMSSWVEDDVRRAALALGAAGVHDKSDLVDSLAPVVGAARPRSPRLAA